MKIQTRNILLIGLLVIISILLLWINTTVSLRTLRKEMMQEITNTDKKLQAVGDNNSENYDNFKTFNKHKIVLASYYLSGLKNPYSRKALKKTESILGASGVYIIDSKGKILVSSHKVNKNVNAFSEYEELCTVSAENPFYSELAVVSHDELPYQEKKQKKDENKDEWLEEMGPESGNNSNQTTDSSSNEDDDEYDYAYVCSWYMDPGHILVLQTNNVDSYFKGGGLHEFWNIYSRQRYVKGSIFFMVEEGVALRVNEEDDFQEIEELGKVKWRNGAGRIITIEGKKYYSCAKYMGGNNNYLVLALPLKEIVFMLCFVNLSVVIATVLSLLLLFKYGVFLGRELVRRRKKNDARRNYTIRLSILLFLCIFMTEVISIHCYTLYTSSFVVSANVLRSQNLQKSTVDINVAESYGYDNYYNVVKTLNQTAAAILSELDDYTNSAKIKEMKEVLGAGHILVYNKQGRVIASDQNYNGMTLSNNPKDMSYAFRWVLRGEPILVQTEPDKSFLSSPYYFSGVPLKDKEGNYAGMVQLAFSPEFYDKLVASSDISTQLSYFRDRIGVIAFAVDMKSGIVNSSSPTYDNLTSKDLGLTEKELTDGYTGYFNIQNVNMLGACQAGDAYWAIVVSKSDPLPVYTFRTGFMHALPCVIAEIIFFLIILSVLNSEDLEKILLLGQASNKKKTIELEAEKQIFTILRWTALLIAGYVSFSVFAGSILYEEGTPGYYIFVYPWGKGLNIFTIARCVHYVCIAGLGMFLLFRVLTLLASLLPSKQETVIRLVSSSAKYVLIVGIILFCLSMLGLPTISIFASAGVLSLVLTAGAQNSVADILAGLFIIFEGSFKVGDMIRVDDYYGKVLDIGIRNTKIHDLINNDIRIMNNSTIKRVINYSVYPSTCFAYIGIEYGADIREMEAVIKRELPVISENMKGLGMNPVYMGIDEFADSSINLKFQISCKNQDFQKARRALNREIKMMFDRNNINVPFPQLVLHEAEDSEEEVIETMSEGQSEGQSERQSEGQEKEQAAETDQ